MIQDLPAPIERYFENEKTDATDRMGECFAPDATVIDENRNHVGLEAIRAWKSEAKAATPYQVTPLSAEKAGSQTIVAARVEGEFPGSPVVLLFFFTLASDRIATLEIRT